MYMELISLFEMVKKKKKKEEEQEHVVHIVHRESTRQNVCQHATINNELNRPPNGEEPDDEFMSDEDGVPETIFGSSSLVPNHRDEDKDAAHSDDPFGLYDLLKNKKGQNVVKSGGSVLDVMEDIIRVGQVMGYSMEGCVKDLENIIGKQGEDNPFARPSPIGPSSILLRTKKLEISGSKNEMISELGAIDKDMDRGVFDDDTVFRRFELKHKLLNVSEMESKDNFQKSKVKWAVEGEENKILPWHHQ
ncbi:hypothetical protein Tco_1017242 [Tanacetum coccineum]|uniref:RNA-directed DNA polymerase, eukaryota n=1 Tax=Tanacetum coccineum TaxID=301880 RepID=A0ABQ5FQX8_9ASTR